LGSDPKHKYAAVYPALSQRGRLLCTGYRKKVGAQRGEQPAYLRCTVAVSVGLDNCGDPAAVSDQRTQIFIIMSNIFKAYQRLYSFAAQVTTSLISVIIYSVF